MFESHSITVPFGDVTSSQEIVGFEIIIQTRTFQFDKQGKKVALAAFHCSENYFVTIPEIRKER